VGRIRTIKPEFFKHSGLYDAEVETGLPLRLAFAGLWTCCDREGRFKWRPRELKLDVLPYDECDFEAVLNSLEAAGFIVRYEVGGDQFGVVPTFLNHQHINQREAQSMLPNQKDTQSHVHARAPIDDLKKDGFTLDDMQRTCMQMHERDEHVGKGKEGKGKEGKGKERKGKIARISFTLPGWIPQELWDSFEEMRRKIRAPMTDRARMGIVNDLSRFKAEGHDPIEILQESIKKSYRGVFVSNGGFNGRSRNKIADNLEVLRRSLTGRQDQDSADGDGVFSGDDPDGTVPEVVFEDPGGGES
jgi:hypothetical protein